MEGVLYIPHKTVLKQCKCCKAIKPQEWFAEGHGDDGRHAFCSKCVNRLSRAQVRRWHQYFYQKGMKCQPCGINLK